MTVRLRADWRVLLAVIVAGAALGVVARVLLDRRPTDPGVGWAQLWSRCVTAVENARPLDADGLRPFQVSPVVLAELVGRSPRYRLLAPPGGKFFIVEQERGPPDASSRVCDVLPIPETPYYNEVDMAVMVDHFINYQLRGMTEGRYKEPYFTRLYPLGFYRFDTTKKNANNCSTTTYLVYHPHADARYEGGSSFYKTGAAEQGVPIACKGRSFLDAGSRERL